jgi:hypothetical protein
VSFDKGTPVARPVRKTRDLASARDGPVAEKAFADARSATLFVAGAPMKRTIPLLVAAAAILIAGCDDEQAKPVTIPTGPAVAPAAAQASASADYSGGSTICRVYVTERDVAKTQLDAAPADTIQQRRVKTLDALVKETCN